MERDCQAHLQPHQGFSTKWSKYVVVHLGTAPRVDNREAFIDMLNEMRFGTLSSKSIQSFKQLSRSIEYEGGLVPTEL